MRKFKVVEIEYDKLRNDLKNNCDQMIKRHNIKFNYDIERDEYVALVKMSKSPLRKRFRNSSPVRISQNFNQRMKNRRKLEKYGIHQKIPRRSIEPNTPHVIQADFHQSCRLSASKTRSTHKRIRSPVVYRPSHKSRFSPRKETKKSVSRKKSARKTQKKTPDHSQQSRFFVT